MCIYVRISGACSCNSSSEYCIFFVIVLCLFSLAKEPSIVAKLICLVPTHWQAQLHVEEGEAPSQSLLLDKPVEVEGPSAKSKSTCWTSPGRHVGVGARPASSNHLPISWTSPAGSEGLVPSKPRLSQYKPASDNSSHPQILCQAGLG